jgi:hypothetical protein
MAGSAPGKFFRRPAPDFARGFLFLRAFCGLNTADFYRHKKPA